MYLKRNDIPLTPKTFLIHSKKPIKTMAYTKLTLDHHEANMKKLNFLAKLNISLDFGNGISLANVIAAQEEEKVAVLAKNALFDALDEASLTVSSKSKKADESIAKLRNSIKIHFGADSDEYVMAGGVRQSDIIAQQKATREENKGVEEEKKKKDMP